MYLVSFTFYFADGNRFEPTVRCFLIIKYWFDGDAYELWKRKMFLDKRGAPINQPKAAWIVHDIYGTSTV